MGVSSQVTTYHELPSLEVPRYVERKKPSTWLEELFSIRNTSCRRIVVLLGMGGTGKTQLALEHCRRMKIKGNFRGIFWLDSSSRNALESSMLSISKQLLPGRMVDNPSDGVKLFVTTLSNWNHGYSYSITTTIHSVFLISPTSSRIAAVVLF